MAREPRTSAFASPTLQATGLGLPSDPYSMFDTSAADIGFGGLRTESIPDYAGMIRQQGQEAIDSFSAPMANTGSQLSPSIFYSPSTRRLNVGGFEFQEEDAASALQSEQYLGRPATPSAEASDWYALPESAYSSYIESVRNPTRGELFGRGFQRGVLGMQTLLGAGLQFAGAESAGAGLVEDAARQLQMYEPYQRQFTDIDDPSSAIDWAVSSFGELFPSMLESGAVALGGFALGTVGGAGNPLVGAGIAISGLVGKTAWRRAALEAARRYAAARAAQNATARSALATLSAAEQNALRQAAALGALTVNNYMTGVADTYNELRQSGADPADIEARMLSAIAGIPYAGFETVPEALLMDRLLGGRFLSSFAGRPVSRVATAAGLGAGIEATAEAGQEATVLGASSLFNNREFLTDENLARLVNSAAAGALGGAVFGGIGGIRAPSEPDAPAPAADILNNPPPPPPPPSEPGPGMGGFEFEPPFPSEPAPPLPQPVEPPVFTGDIAQAPTEFVPSPGLGLAPGAARLRRPTAQFDLRQPMVANEGPGVQLEPPAPRTAEAILESRPDIQVARYYNEADRAAIPGGNVTPMEAARSGSKAGVLRDRPNRPGGRVVAIPPAPGATVAQATPTAPVTPSLIPPPPIPPMAAGMRATTINLRRGAAPVAPAAPPRKQIKAIQLKPEFFTGPMPQAVEDFRAEIEATPEAQRTPRQMAWLEEYNRMRAEAQPAPVTEQKLKKGKKNAAKKPSAKALLVGDRPEAGAQVRGGDTGQQEAAGARDEGQAQPEINEEKVRDAVVAASQAAEGKEGEAALRSMRAVISRKDRGLSQAEKDEAARQLNIPPMQTPEARAARGKAFIDEKKTAEAVWNPETNSRLVDAVKAVANARTDDDRAAAKQSLLNFIGQNEAFVKAWSTRYKGPDGKRVRKREGSQPDIIAETLAEYETRKNVKPAPPTPESARPPLEYGVAKMYIQRLTSKINKKLAKRLNIHRNWNDVLASMTPEQQAFAQELRRREPRTPAFTLNGDIFFITGNINTKRELVTIVAHEVIGHYGFLGSVAGDDGTRLRNKLDELYGKSPDIRDRADAIMAGTRAKDKYEAIEEALADYVGETEFNLFHRTISWFKNLLGRMFGIEFEDSLVEATIRIARAYARLDVPTVQAPISDYIRAAPAAGAGATPGANPNAGMFTAVAEASLPWGGGVSSDNSGAFGFLGAMRDRMDKDELKTNVSAVLQRFVRTVQDAANKSPMLQALSNVFRDTAQEKLALVRDVDNIQEVIGKMSIFGGGGLTTAQRQEVSNIMGATHDFFIRKYGTDADKLEKAHGPLAIIRDNGNIEINETAFAAYADAGIMTPGEINAGFDTFYEDGTKNYSFNKADSKIKLATPLVDADDPRYAAYLQLRKANNYIARKRLENLIDGLGGGFVEQGDRILSNHTFSREVSDADAKWLAAVGRYYLTLRDETVSETNQQPAKRAEEWLESILQVLHDNKFAEAWISGTASDADIDVKPRLKYAVDADIRKTMTKDIIAGIPSIRDLKSTRDQQYDILGSLRRQLLGVADIRSEDARARQTIAGGYFGKQREGDWVVRMAMYYVDGPSAGRPAIMPDTVREKLPFMMTRTQPEAREMADQLEKEFSNDFEIVEDDGTARKVKFVPTVERAPKTAGLAEMPSIYVVRSVLERLGVNLKPKDIEKLVIGLTKAGDRARKSMLKYSGTPGWSADVIKSNSSWQINNTSLAAKMKFRWRFDNALDNRNLLRGSESELRRLEAAHKAARNTAEKIITRDNLLQYLRQYATVAPIVQGKDTVTVEVDGKPVTRRLEGRAAEFEELAKALVRFYTTRRDVVEDIDSYLEQFTGPLRSFAATMFLGGTFASGFIQLFSLYTSFAPYMAGHNLRTGYGGGFGDGRVMAEMHAVIAKIGSPTYGADNAFEDIYTKKTWAAKGLSERQSLFMSEAERGNNLGASNILTLLGQTNSPNMSVLTRAFIEKWMSLFVAGEQFNRRVAYLTAYNLYSQRLVEAGLDPAMLLDKNSDAFKTLMREVEKSVDQTQGQYALWNTPEFFRGPLGRVVFMFKMFPVTFVQLIGNVSTRQKIQMLALLFVLAGLKGMPFADDLMDIIDGLLQRLGIRQASVEQAVNEFIYDTAILMGADEETAGTITIGIMRGWLDVMIGGSFSPRLGLGDLIPFTGMLREGADVGRELESGFGPVWAAATSMVDYAGLGLDLGLQYTGFKDRTGDLSQLVRESPIAGVRQLESLMWGMDGEVTDRQGRVVFDDVGANVLALRALGFYPAEATRANDIVRLGRYTSDYVKRITASYRNAWSDARRRGDRERMREIERAVRDWNKAAREAGDTDFIIENFRARALRASEERARGTVERYQRTTDLESTERLAAIYGLED